MYASCIHHDPPLCPSPPRRPITVHFPHGDRDPPLYLFPTKTHRCVPPHGNPPLRPPSRRSPYVLLPLGYHGNPPGHVSNWSVSFRRPAPVLVGATNGTGAAAFGALDLPLTQAAPAPAPAQCRPVPPKAARCRPPAPPMAMRAEWFPVNGISARGKWSIGGAQSLKATAYMKLWTGYEVMDGRWAIRINKYVRLTCSMFAEILETRFRVGLAAGIFE